MSNLNLSGALLKTKFWEKLPENLNTLPLLQVLLEFGLIDLRTLWEVNLKPTASQKLGSLFKKLDLLTNDQFYVSYNKGASFRRIVDDKEATASVELINWAHLHAVALIIITLEREHGDFNSAFCELLVELRQARSFMVGRESTQLVRQSGVSLQDTCSFYEKLKAKYTPLCGPGRCASRVEASGMRSTRAERAVNSCNFYAHYGLRSGRDISARSCNVESRSVVTVDRDFEDLSGYQLAPCGDQAKIQRDNVSLKEFTVCKQTEADLGSLLRANGTKTKQSLGEITTFWKSSSTDNKLSMVEPQKRNAGALDGRGLKPKAGITRVTVTEGEFVDVLASNCTGLTELEKLRNFSASNEGLDFSSDDDELSSLTSSSSLSSEVLEEWLREEDSLSLREDETCGVNSISVVRKSDKNLRVSETKIKMEIDCAREISNENLAREKQERRGNGDSKVIEETDFTWAAQKSVFWTLKHEILNSTTKFSKIMTPLRKFQFFTNQQLEELGKPGNNNPEMLFSAIGERIDSDRNAMAVFLLGLRNLNPQLVEQIHQRVFSSVSNAKVKPLSVSRLKRPSSSNTDLEGPSTYNNHNPQKLQHSSVSSSKTHALPGNTKQAFNANVIVSGSNDMRHETKTISQNPRPRDFSRFGNIPTSSPYSRRPFTINSALNHDHVMDIKRNYIVPRSSPYFSKASRQTQNYNQFRVADPFSSTKYNRSVAPKSTDWKSFPKENFEKEKVKVPKKAGKSKDDTIERPKSNISSLRRTASCRTVQDDVTNNDTDDVTVPEPEKDDVMKMNENTSCSLSPSSDDKDVVQTLAQKFQDHFTDVDASYDVTGCDDVTQSFKDTNVNPFVNELICACIISTRSAWLIRKCPNIPERMVMFSDALVGLNTSDCNDVINNCPLTSQWLKTICKKKMRDENEQQLNKKSVDISNIKKTDLNNNAGTAATNASLSDSAMEMEATSLNYGTINCVKKTNTEELLNTSVTSLTDRTSHITNQDSKCIQTAGNYDVPGSSNGHSDVVQCALEGNDAASVHDILSSYDAILVAPGDEHEKKEFENESAEEISARANADIQNNTADTVLEAKADDPMVKRSLSQLLIKKTDNNRSKLEDIKSTYKSKSPSNKPTRKGSFVSHVLFPISTRKNSKLRNSKAEKNTECKAEAKTDKKVVKAAPKPEENVSENSTALGVEDSAKTVEEDLVENVVPKEDQLGAASEEDESFENPSSNESETVSDEVNDNSKDSDQLRKGIAENENCTNNQPSVVKAPLVAILSNGGGAANSSNKKKGARVSFSELPPLEIEVGPPNLKSEPISTSLKVQPLPAGTNDTSQAADTSLKRPATPLPASLSDSPWFVPPAGQNQVKSKRCITPSPSNEIDQINELLMDILEEIEAENISLNRCLADLVTEKLLTQEMANSVTPTYSENSDCVENDLSEADRERAVEKLLDVLTNLGLITLTKCRNLILGRLCQLSSYEAFENAQKAAAALKVDNDVTDDVSNSIFVEAPSAEKLKPTASGRNPSSEDSELSATESDEDFHGLRHKLGRHHNDVTADAIKEVDEEGQDGSDPVAPSLEEKDVKSVLPLLIDNSAIEPKNVWSILSSESETEQKQKLKFYLHRLKDEKLKSLFLIPDLSWLEELMGSDDVQSSAHLRKHQVKISRASSVRIPVAKPGSTASVSHAVSLINEQYAPVTSQTERCQGNKLKRTASARVPNRKYNDVRLPWETTEEETSAIREQGMPDASTSLDEWCSANHLCDQSATSLRLNGFKDLEEVSRISEDGIEDLKGLSWIQKAKLWVAVENLRHVGLRTSLNCNETIYIM
ncbi:uncharacterized protein LOC100180752 [Ciona intestinalis]